MTYFMLSNFSPCFFRKTSDCILVSNSRHCFGDDSDDFLFFKFRPSFVRNDFRKFESSFLYKSFFKKTNADSTFQVHPFWGDIRQYEACGKEILLSDSCWFSFLPLSGLTKVTGRSGCWPPTFCLHGGRSNFNRRTSQLIHIMDAACTSSWMAHAIKCYLVPSL